MGRMLPHWSVEELEELHQLVKERYNWHDGALRAARRERMGELRPLMKISRLAKEAKLLVRSGDFSKVPRLQRELAKLGVEKTVEELKDPWAIEDAVEIVRELITGSEKYKEKLDRERRARAVVESFDNRIVMKLQEKGDYLPKPLAALDNLDPELEAEVQEILKRRAERREQYKKREEKEGQKEKKDEEKKKEE